MSKWSSNPDVPVLFSCLDTTESVLQTVRPGGSFHKWIRSDGGDWALFYRQADHYLICFPGLADFRISDDGQRVQGQRSLGVSDATLEHLYQNQVLPLALSRQGKLVLHASAVVLPQGAVAFIGRSGQGKSTLAASFASSGFEFLTDDGLLLKQRDSAYWVQPSHPSIRLWDDSRAALIASDAALAPPVQYTPKVRVLSGDGLPFCETLQPLRRVYFLGDSSPDNVSIEPLKPSEALIGLVNHSFLLDIEARNVIARHFDELTQMVERPMYYRLDYPRRYDELPRVREAILRHAMETESPPT